MSFDLDYHDLDPAASYTSASDAATVEFGDLRWRIPWRTQLRWFAALVWARGWAAVWQDGLWWRITEGESQ